MADIDHDGRDFALIAAYVTQRGLNELGVLAVMLVLGFGLGSQILVNHTGLDASDK